MHGNANQVNITNPNAFRPANNEVSSIAWVGHIQCDSLKINAKTSSNQNSILKEGSGRTFLFQTENLFFNIDFMGRKLEIRFIGKFLNLISRAPDTKSRY